MCLYMRCGGLFGTVFGDFPETARVCLKRGGGRGETTLSYPRAVVLSLHYRHFLLSVRKCSNWLLEPLYAKLLRLVGV
jgi:hypothetical protein